MFEFEPVWYMRCHQAIENDATDITTPVWDCSFEPNLENAEKDSYNFSTCGGNTVCCVNAVSGELQWKYTINDKKEKLYTLTWAVVRKACGVASTTVLATGGLKGIVYLIDSKSHVCFFKQKLIKSTFNCLMFHPDDATMLFGGTSKGSIMVWSVDINVSEISKAALSILYSLSCTSEVISMSISVSYSLLLVGCEEGLYTWKIDRYSEDNDIPLVRKVEIAPSKNNDSNSLVDSVVVTGSNCVAVKFARHNCIYLLDLDDISLERNDMVCPMHVLQWSNTDDYYMNMGCNIGGSLLACGDNVGDIWVYNLEDKSNYPVKILQCPHFQSRELDSFKKKVFPPIIVNKVAVHHSMKYIIAVTSRNIIGIWENNSINNMEV